MFLRVTNEDNTYTDYGIFHYDMNVTIDDDDAHIYKDEDGYYIDYSPETLGELLCQVDILTISNMKLRILLMK